MAHKPTDYLRVLMTGGLPELERDCLADGLAAYAAGRHEAAFPDLIAGLEKKPDHVGALTAVARILLNSQRYFEAETFTRQALSFHEKDPALHCLLGEIFHAQRDLEQAEACYRQATVVKPEFTDAHIRLGVLLFETRQLKQALTSLNQAIFLDRHAAVARFYVAQICLEFEDFQRALTQLYLVDKIQPGFTPVYQTRATIYEHIGDYRQAIVEFNQLIDAGVADAVIHFRLGLAHMRLRSKDLALKAFQKAVELEPRHWEALYHVAQLHEEGKRYNQALEAYRPLLASKAYAEVAKLAVGRIMKMLAEIALQMQGRKSA